MNFERHIIGCMTGTSLDGLDAALVRVIGTGLDMQAQCLGVVSRPLGELATTLRSFAEGDAHPPLDYLRAARQLGELHAEAVAILQHELPLDAALVFVAAHGQTIHHAPDEGLSWQLFDPWPIVRQVGVPVVYDLRQADLIAGGQGAPLTPLADWILFRHPTAHRYIVNLGGICNVTFLPAGGSPEQIAGYDAGPCNLLLDGLVQRLFPGNPGTPGNPGITYDQDGRLARQGTPGNIHFHESPPPLGVGSSSPRSLGREAFGEAYIDHLIAAHPNLSPHDILASAVAHVADTIAAAVRDGDDAPQRNRQIILAGGSARNSFLVEMIRRRCEPTCEVLLSDALGVPIEAREAIAFAILGALSRDGIPISLPRVTGSTASAGVAGVWAGRNV